MERNRVLLCLAHMSGNEMRYIQEAFDTNWVVPLGPNVNGFEDDLRRFSVSVSPSGVRRNFLEKRNIHRQLWRMRIILIIFGRSLYQN